MKPSLFPIVGMATSATLLLFAGLINAEVCAEDAVDASQSTDAVEAVEREFTLNVLPLLTEKCLGCHGGEEDDIKGEYSVLNRDDLLRGGESEETAIVPGKPDEGTLMDAISWNGMEMPPKENDRLTEEQVELVRNWIQHGAPWPDAAKQSRYREEERTKVRTKDGLIVTTSGGTSQQWTDRRYQPGDLWSWSKVKSTPEVLPKGVAAREAIDFFVDRKIDESELESAPEASPRALMRVHRSL